MGTFLIYRIAGGEAGMRHFLAQFGPTLRWPWSKLTDVPDLDESLLDKIVMQSDEQAGGKSVRELERFRDDCLVAVLQGLRSHGAGAGAVLAEHERALFELAHARAMRQDDDLSRPLHLHSTRVPPEWVDYNGHVNESRYLQVLADASDAFVRYLGVDSAYLATGGHYFTAETHLSFLDQTGAEDVVEVSTQVLSADDKRLHLYHRLERSKDRAVLAVSETMLLHVDVRSGKVTPAGTQVADRARKVAEAHSHLARPERAGRRIGDRGT